MPQNNRLIEAMKELLELDDPQQSAKAAWIASLEQTISDCLSSAWVFSTAEDNEHHTQLIKCAEERGLSDWAIFMEQVASDELAIPPEEWTGIIIERKQDAQE